MTEREAHINRNRPQEVLLDGLAADLAPMVQKLREEGWPAEVWVVKATADQPYHVAVRIPLSTVPVPVEHAAVWHE